MLSLRQQAEARKRIVGTSYSVGDLAQLLRLEVGSDIEHVEKLFMKVSFSVCVLVPL